MAKAAEQNATVEFSEPVAKESAAEFRARARARQWRAAFLVIYPVIRDQYNGVPRRRKLAIAVETAVLLAEDPH